MRVPLSQEKLKELLEEIKPLIPWLNSISDQMIITDENANIIFANKAVENQTGFKPEEAVGKNPGDLWGGNMTKDMYQKMWQTIKIEKKPFVCEVENTKKDGSKYWQELRISPVLDKNGEIRFFIGMEPNITGRKKVEEEKEDLSNISQRWDQMLVEQNYQVAELKREIEELRKELNKK